MMIHSPDSLDKTAWNNWNFSSKAEWDSAEEGFLYDKKTTLLFETAEFVIG